MFLEAARGASTGCNSHEAIKRPPSWIPESTFVDEKKRRDSILGVLSGQRTIFAQTRMDKEQR